MIRHFIRLLKFKADKRYKQVHIKSINENISPFGMDYTIYFQLADKNVFIPIDLTFDSGQNIVMVSECENYPRPHVYDTLRRTIYGLGGIPRAVLIAMYSGGIYYTFIQVEKDKELLEIDAKFSDAISTAIVCKIPIFVEEKLSEIVGINVDEEMEKINEGLTGI